jgi:hypothetical protein
VLLSTFFRWVHPRSRVEVYGEFGREDRSQNVRDLIAEPDHASGILVGLQRVFSANADVLSAFRAEVLNTRVTHLGNVRPELLPYVHGSIVQGHTQLGQVLGAPGGAGGGGFTLSYERHTRTRSWSAGLTRLMGCGGTGGTGNCDAEALELGSARRAAGMVYSTGLSLVNRRVSPDRAERTTGLSIQWSVRRGGMF